MMESYGSQEELFSALQHLKFNKHEVVLFHTLDKSLEIDFNFENRPYIFEDIESGERLKLFPNEVKDHYEKETAAFITGFRDGHAKKAAAYTEEELQAAYVEFQKQLQQKQLNETKKAQTTNNSFLTENAKKEGVKKTASGLQYKITQEGTGKQPAATSVVKVHYKGQLTDGKVFDSSYDRGEPIEFPLNQVIPGWTEALQLMPAGSTWEVYIPSGLAYGPRSVGGPIGPNETLIFKIHLLSVKKAGA